jgi:hypothetical protein
MAVCWPAHLVAVGGSARGTVGSLPSSGAVPLTSNVDINEAGRGIQQQPWTTVGPADEGTRGGRRSNS